MRVSAITTPPLCATDPPESPVPAPRGTIGSLLRARDLHNLRNLLDRLRQDHRCRFGGLDSGVDRAVVLVHHQVRRPAKDVAGANSALE